MSDEIKVGSITKRWIFNVLSIAVASVLLFEVVFGIIIYQFIITEIEDQASVYAQSFRSLSSYSGESFDEAAKSLTEAFKYADKIEVQVLDENGILVASTGKFMILRPNDMKDYIAARDSKSGMATWRGRLESGEMVAAGTVILDDFGNGVNGAYRWMVSLQDALKYIYFLIGAAILFGLFIIASTVFSGIYFIKSIVIPVREVSAITRKIACGSFDVNMSVRRNDEIGELCDSINYMANELSHVENLKNDFVSSVSHELRTPLTAIRGWGETVKMSIGSDDQAVRRGIEIILGESERLSQLVEELLDFSRMQSGNLVVEMTMVDISEVVGEVVEMYHELAARQKIDLTFISPNKTILVKADKNRIKQVFINIIDNAVKYSQPGGFVLVTTVVEQECIRVIVSDTGVGIAAQDLDHVKERFFRSNKTVSGNGIGLAVADEILKQHNGLLFLESTQGVGTKVTVVLPTVKEEDTEPTAIYFPPQDEDGEQVTESVNSLEDIENISNSSQEGEG
ncbi:MAG: HAMP domain-containing sensor histidine kinase [bacterium]|nr:HAMP domain-containing sensor histidine kinase [bacterium]